MQLGQQPPRCVLFEDEHLLVVNKPAGLNTHAPSPMAGEGLFEWLRHREWRWASLAIIHRLDKDTSGVLVFAKTPLANQSLTRQFTEHQVRKTYLAWTDRPVAFNRKRVQSSLVRAGDHYVSVPDRSSNQAATAFRVMERNGPVTVLEACPETGRTHQIRVHARDLGCPLLGDVLYGGTPAQRLYLHAASLTLRHPASGEEIPFTAPPDFAADVRLEMRRALLSQDQTDAFRLLHGHADRVPGIYADQLGRVMLVESEAEISPEVGRQLLQLKEQQGIDIILHKLLRHDVRGVDKTAVSPLPWSGQVRPDSWVVKENGVSFLLKGGEGYSVGLFLDQRENRRRLLNRYIGANMPLFTAGLLEPHVLNTFAYTCGFSVCAALTGACTTSLDLSGKYLDWGRENFRLNQLDPARHEFIGGDFFDWTKRWARKNRRFDLIILDPPTFSTSKQSGIFRVEKDYPRLLRAVLPLLRSGGVILACANTIRLEASAFCAMIRRAITQNGSHILREQWMPQPPDFPISRLEPAHLKSVWLWFS
jgi:23S rRNA (cytosine1962-C5)-methyltransferase